MPGKLRFDCSRCPGYCCSYPRIEIKPEDVQRLAQHFNIPVDVAQRRFTQLYSGEGADPQREERILRHRKDTVYATVCRFLDQAQRRCSVYEARPDVCRQYPGTNSCGYYTFLRFERRHQNDEGFIPSA